MRARTLPAAEQKPCPPECRWASDPLADVRGLRAARLASFGAVQADVGETGEGYVTMTLHEVDDDLEPGMAGGVDLSTLTGS